MLLWGIFCARLEWTRRLYNADTSIGDCQTRPVVRPDSGGDDIPFRSLAAARLRALLYRISIRTQRNFVHYHASYLHFHMALSLLIDMYL